MLFESTEAGWENKPEARQVLRSTLTA